MTLGLQTRMLLQVHDEQVFETPEAEADRAIAVIKRVMEKAAGNWDEAH